MLCNRCRKSKEREAICAADDGAAPPLSQRGPALPWGHLGGSEALMPPGLRQVCFSCALLTPTLHLIYTVNVLLFSNARLPTPSQGPQYTALQ